MFILIKYLKKLNSGTTIDVAMYMPLIKQIKIPVTLDHFSIIKYKSITSILSAIDSTIYLFERKENHDNNELCTSKLNFLSKIDHNRLFPIRKLKEGYVSTEL